MVRILNSAGSPTGSPSSLQNFAPSPNRENRQRLAGKARDPTRGAFVSFPQRDVGRSHPPLSRDCYPVEKVRETALVLRQLALLRVCDDLNRAAFANVEVAPVDHGNRSYRGLDLQEPESNTFDPASIPETNPRVRIYGLSIRQSNILNRVKWHRGALRDDQCVATAG